MGTQSGTFADRKGVQPAASLNTKPCRCGCGFAVANHRVFLDKSHQIAWLRAQGAKRRRTTAGAADTQVLATTSSADAPVTVVEVPPVESPFNASPSNAALPAATVGEEPGAPATETEAVSAQSLEDWLRSWKTRAEESSPAPAVAPVLVADSVPDALCPAIEDAPSAAIGEVPWDEIQAGLRSLRDKLRYREADDATMTSRVAAAGQPTPTAERQTGLAAAADEPDVETAADEPDAEPQTLSLAGEVYVVGFALTAVPVFLVTWLFCVMAFGLPLGGGFGWIPGIVAGAAAGIAWPVGVVAALAAVAAVL